MVIHHNLQLTIIGDERWIQPRRNVSNGIIHKFIANLQLTEPGTAAAATLLQPIHIDAIYYSSFTIKYNYTYI